MSECEQCKEKDKELEQLRVQMAERLKNGVTGWTRDHQDLWSEMVRQMDKPEYMNLTRYVGTLEVWLKDAKAKLAEKDAEIEMRTNAMSSLMKQVVQAEERAGQMLTAYKDLEATNEAAEERAEKLRRGLGEAHAILSADLAHGARWRATVVIERALTAAPASQPSRMEKLEAVKEKAWGLRIHGPTPSGTRADPLWKALDELAALDAADSEKGERG